jgi:Ca2+-binding EF-hand superfamily protein
MTKTFIGLAAVTTALLAAPAFAATLDADGDGLVTLEEMTAAMPEISEETFMLIDANADGTVDAEELAAAEQAGTIPPQDS